MRIMELKCIHQNTLSTCAGKDHCQEKQKQTHERSVSCFGFFGCWLLVLLYLDLQIRAGRVHRSLCHTAFWSFPIRHTPVLYLAYVGIAMRVPIPGEFTVLWKCL